MTSNAHFYYYLSDNSCIILNYLITRYTTKLLEICQYICCSQSWCRNFIFIFRLAVFRLLTNRLFLLLLDVIFPFPSTLPWMISFSILFQRTIWPKKFISLLWIVGKNRWRGSIFSYIKFDIFFYEWSMVFIIGIYCRLPKNPQFFCDLPC